MSLNGKEAETQNQWQQQQHLESNNNDLHKDTSFTPTTPAATATHASSSSSSTALAPATANTNLDAPYPSLSSNSDNHSNSNSLSRRSLDVHHTLDINEQPINSNNSSKTTPTTPTTVTPLNSTALHQYTSGNDVPYGQYRNTLPPLPNYNNKNHTNIPTIQHQPSQDDNFKLFTIYGNGELVSFAPNFATN